MFEELYCIHVWSLHLPGCGTVAIVMFVVVVFIMCNVVRPKIYLAGCGVDTMFQRREGFHSAQVVSLPDKIKGTRNFRLLKILH